MAAVDGDAPAAAPAPEALTVQDVLGWLTENGTVLKFVGPALQRRVDCSRG